MATVTVKINSHSDLIGRYHGLCRTLGMDKENKKDFLSAWGVGSSTQLTTQQLTEVIDTLQGMVQQRDQVANDWRKRVIASIAGFLDVSPEFGKLLAQKAPADQYRFKLKYIISMACRAAECKEFNEIPVARLQNLYYGFRQKQKDWAAIEQVVYDVKMNLLTQNINEND